MTTPIAAAERFLWACLLGAGLGAAYGFLRPLRWKHPILADSVFIIFLFQAWLQLGFGICGGDLRLAYLAGLPIGAIAFDQTVGRLIKPIFVGFWNGIGALFRLFLYPLKKILKNAKILIASVKKWGTIRWNTRRYLRRKPGGKTNGKNQSTSRRQTAGLPPQHEPDQNHGTHGSRVVYGSTGGTAPVNR